MNQGEVSFTLDVSPDMAPTVQIVVYAILPSQEFIAHYVSLSTGDCFKNEVSLNSHVVTVVSCKKCTPVQYSCSDSNTSPIPPHYTPVFSDSTGSLSNSELISKLCCSPSKLSTTYSLVPVQYIQTNSDPFILTSLSSQGDRAFQLFCTQTLTFVAFLMPVIVPAIVYCLFFFICSVASSDLKCALNEIY